MVVMSKEIAEKLLGTKKVIGMNDRLTIIGVGAIMTTDGVSDIMKDLAKAFVRINKANGDACWEKEYIFVSYLVKANNRTAYIVRPKNIVSDTIKVDYYHRDINIDDVEFDLYVSTVYMDTLDIKVSDMSMYESFVGNEHIELNYIIEGMIAGYNGVESVDRREWMEQHLEPLVMWVKNVSYVDKLFTYDATLVLKAMIYFCEMNQDKHNNSVLDGFKNFIAHYTTAKKISDISSFSSVEFYIPELKTMHPYTQSIIKHIMGEMYLILVHALLKVELMGN